MYFKLDSFLVIVVMMTIHIARSAPSEVTPILNPNELGSKCSILPEPRDSTLGRLVKKNCYVDKTEYLIKMLSRTQVYWFIARPSGFGKTLLVDVLEAFFTGKQELFKNTAIYQTYIKSILFIRYTSGWPKYPVIRLDFSTLATDSVSDFEYSMLRMLEDIAKLHDIQIDDKVSVTAICDLIHSLHAKYNKPVVVLIDEFDSPYTRSFAKNKEVASEVLGTLGDFGCTLKSRRNNIDFCFMTGITWLPPSDFAGVTVDLTMDPDYAGIVGFNQTELCQYFGGYIKDVAKTSGRTTTEVLNEMRKRRGGFRFTAKNESLYRPGSVIGYLKMAQPMIGVTRQAPVNFSS